MNNQHMNGGLAVDTWGRTNLAGCYAVGEAAGTHGVTRPGGAALNAGQVFGTRCAEHIAARVRAVAEGAEPGDHRALITGALAAVAEVLRADSGLTVAGIRQEVQARMSDHAGMICRAADVRSALDAARRLNDAIRRQGIAHQGNAFEAAQALQWRQMAIASEAVLTALDAYLTQGGGSRGARMVCDAAGDLVPATRLGPLEDARFLSERESQRQEQILVRLDAQQHAFEVHTVALPAIDRGERPFFERHWPDFLTGQIFA
jgi:succinate dehydrogenase / fumarate reductase, flavoprotein subunit